MTEGRKGCRKEKKKEGRQERWYIWKNKNDIYPVQSKESSCNRRNILNMLIRTTLGT